jgi:hypothetical protein
MTSTASAPDRTSPFRGLSGYLLLPLLLALAAALGAGCITQSHGNVVLGKSYQPSNVFGKDQPWKSLIRRVAVLPLAVPHQELQAGRETLEPVIPEELGKTHRFEVVRVTPQQLQSWVGRASLTTAEVIPSQLLTNLIDKLGCDAVLFPELTQFRAYPPVVVGWNLKLVETRSGQVLWAADEVFDARQPAVVTGARVYHLKNSRYSAGMADSQFILLCPSDFGRYSAQALFATFPPAPAS